MFCYQCGAPMGEKDLFCGVCGARQDAAAPVSAEPPMPKVCSECGTPYTDEGVFCSGCGARLGQSAPVVEETVVFPVVEAPAPVTEEPASVVEETVVLPVVEESAPAAEETQVFQAVEETQVFTAPAKACPVCGTAYTDADVFCGTCGTNLSAPEVIPDPVKTCPTCGTPHTDEDVFCGTCGTSLTADAAPVPPVIPQAPVQAQTIAQQQAAPQKKKKKGLLIALLILIPLLIAGAVGAYLIITENNNSAAYNDAVALLENRQYEEALEAFRALGTYKDSADQVKALEDLQSRYDAAVELLENDDFDAAKAEFEQLGDYRDSQEMYMYETDYQKAMYICRSALDGMDYGLAYVDDADSYEDSRIAQYLAGIQIFESLGNYKDSQEAITSCYEYICDVYLEYGNYDMALYYAESVSQDYYEGIYQIYMSTCADDRFLMLLQDAYFAWEDAFDNDYFSTDECVYIQLSYLEEIEGVPFDDPDLEGYYMAYVNNLHSMDYVIDVDYITDYVEYYEIVMDQYQILMDMHLYHGFLPEDDYEEYFTEVIEYYSAMRSIEEMVLDQLVGVAAEYDEAADEYYMYFTNTSGISFDMWILLEFYQGDAYVSDTGWYSIEVGPYETVQVPVYFDMNADWDTWYIYWDYDNIVP